MAKKVEYKFKPYKPTKFKIAGTSTDDVAKTISSLEKQRANLDKRLRAEGIDPDTLGGEFDNRNIIEKALNLTPDQGFLMDFFEVIDRPVQAVKQALVAGKEGENILEGFFEGIAGQERISGSEFVSELTGGGIQPETGLGKFITDVGADIVFDPLTYLPPGLLLKGFSKLGKLGGKTILKEIGEEGVEALAKRTAAEYIDDLTKRAAREGVSLEDLVRREANTKDVMDLILFESTGSSMDDLIKSNPKLLSREEELVEMVNKGTRKGKKIKGATASELKAHQSLYKKIEAIDPDFKVVLNKTSDRYDDVAIFYKTQINGKDALVKLRGIEVKNLISGPKEAFFSNLILQLAGDSVSLASGTSVSQTVQDVMNTAFNTVRMKDGQTLGQFLNKTLTRIRKVGNTKGINFIKNVAAEDLPKLRAMFEDIAKGTSSRAVTFLDTPSGGKLVKLSDMLDNVEESFQLMFEKGQNQVRFRTSFKIKNVDDLAKLPDATGELIKDLSSTPSTLKEQEVFITLAGRARAGEFGKTVQTIAKAYKKLEINFKLTFNLTAGFDEKTASLIKRAYGENMFELERRSNVLAEIKRELIKVDPDAGALLGEIIEADAKIVNGKIVKLKRRMGTSDFLDYTLKRVQDGSEVVMPSFPSEAAKQNFLRKLNDIYRGTFSTTDDLFSVAVGKRGGTVLKVKGDAKDLKEIVKYVNEASLVGGRNIPDFLEFGEKALSSKTKAFLRNNIQKIDEYKQLSNEILDELIEVAGFDNLPRELSGQIGYMRHMMSREAFEGLQRQLPGALSIYARPGRDTLAKRTFIGSAAEVNAAMKDFYGLADDLFDPNAFNAMEDLIKVAQRKLDQKRVLDIILTEKSIDATELIKVVDNTQDARRALSDYDVMFNDFKEEFGALYKNLSPSAQETFDDFLKASGFDSSKAIQMNKSAYNVLKGAEKAYVDIPKLVTIYDKFLNTWKGLTLITPGFHMRNLFGNSFNSYAVGMDIISQGKYLNTSMMELQKFQEVGKKLAQGLDITASERKIFETVQGYFEQGVSQTHRGIRDLEGVMEASAKNIKQGGRLKNTYNNVIRFNFNIAEKMDDVQRYALYRWSLDTTGDMTKAANTVAEALFDYSHLTPFEKNTMKNNFVFQAKNIFKNPRQYARLGRAYKYALEDLGGYTAEDLPDYASENMWLPIPMTVDKNDKEAIAFLKANLPLSDFTELVENPFKKGVVSITAPVKLLIEFGAGRDLFTGAPLESFPGQTNAMEEGTGVLSGLRDRRGNFIITQSPLFQKILNDLGLRAPINFASTGLDLVDTLTGYQGGVENFGDFLQRMGLAGVQETERLKLSALYQDLEKLRELKQFYEQETGNQLPVLPRG